MLGDFFIYPTNVTPKIFVILTQVFIYLSVAGNFRVPLTSKCVREFPQNDLTFKWYSVVRHSRLKFLKPVNLLSKGKLKYVAYRLFRSDSQRTLLCASQKQKQCNERNTQHAQTSKEDGVIKAQRYQ